MYSSNLFSNTKSHMCVSINDNRFVLLLRKNISILLSSSNITNINKYFIIIVCFSLTYLCIYGTYFLIYKLLRPRQVQYCNRF